MEEGCRVGLPKGCCRRGPTKQHEDRAQGDGGRRRSREGAGRGPSPPTDGVSMWEVVSLIRCKHLGVWRLCSPQVAVGWPRCPQISGCVWGGQHGEHECSWKRQAQRTLAGDGDAQFGGLPVQGAGAGSGGGIVSCRHRARAVLRSPGGGSASHSFLIVYTNKSREGGRVPFGASPSSSLGNAESARAALHRCADSVCGGTSPKAIRSTFSPHTVTAHHLFIGTHVE